MRSAAGHTATASVLPPPPPINPSSAQQATHPATILHQMFSTCVARGIAAKLVLKSVGGQVVTSLYCSSPSTAASAACANWKQGRKRPDNERRRMRREAWLQRRHSSKPGPAAQTAAVVSAVPVPEGETTAAAAVLASEGTAAAASGQHLAQSLVHVKKPAALGTASAVPASAASTPPRTWAWEPRSRLVVVARKVQAASMESPTLRELEAIGDLNVSLCSMTEELTEVEEREEGAELEPVYRPPPTPPPWSCIFCHLSNPPLRGICIGCLEPRKRSIHGRSPTCGSDC